MVSYIKGGMLRVFENRILRQIFGPKRNANRACRGLHNETNSSLYRLRIIVSVIESRILRCAGHVARMEKARSAYKVLTGKPTGKEHLEGVGVDGGQY